jgi:diadenosine tetraphosphate (Ap4A) HIT family hydrolase
MSNLPKPQAGAIFYEDEQLYATLAEFPITRGHVVIVWKESVRDLGRLNEEDYDHLMEEVDKVRNVMMKVLGVEKVYLIYMDEAEHVHWQLVPRYNEKGFDVFHHEPGKLADVGLAREFEKELE